MFVVLVPQSEGAGQQPLSGLSLHQVATVPAFPEDVGQEANLEADHPSSESSGSIVYPLIHS